MFYVLHLFRQWNDEQQEEFMNPETAPERLEEFLSLVLGQRVRILNILPNDTVRIADEHSLIRHRN